MANINFTDFESKRGQSSFSDRPRVGYFSSLKDDGDEAIIRLNYNTKADFKIITVHRVLVDNKWRNVECLKGLYDTDDKCPLCASGDKMKSKIFVQLLQYNKDEQGNISVEPKIWERGYGFVPELMDTIKDAIEDEKITAQTPIRDIVFKVVRIGAKGSLDTKYKLKVMKPAVVPENIFVKDFSAFDKFDSAYHDYYQKTAEEIKYYLETKSFPDAKSEEKVNTVTGGTSEVKATVKEEPAAVKVENSPATTVTETKETTKTPARYAW